MRVSGCALSPDAKRCLALKNEPCIRFLSSIRRMVQAQLVKESRACFEEVHFLLSNRRKTGLV